MAWVRKKATDARNWFTRCTSGNAEDTTNPNNVPKPKPDAEPTPKPDTKPDTEPNSVPKPEDKPDPEPTPDPKPEVKPDPEPTPKPEPEVPESEPKPEPVPESEPTPVTPTDSPAPAPTPDPKPDPEPTPDEADPTPPDETDPSEDTDNVVDNSPAIDPPNDGDLDNIEPTGEMDVFNEDVLVRMGRVTTTMDTRSDPGKIEVTRPEASPDNLYVDPDFTEDKAFANDIGIDWKRPGELGVSNPCLYSEGITRFDVNQGSLGSCWFLAVLSRIADKQKILDQIIPEDGYKIGTPEYDGIFHCRFWSFGEWIDVYTDDYLPIYKGTSTPWGVRSMDENEMWVSLLEKAFAKFLGSYDNANGGYPGDAFINLTGGIAENFKLNEHRSQDLYPRMKHAFESGSIIICGVPDKNDGKMGLIGGHAYTMTAISVVTYGGSQQVPLVRIRNPWGKRKGEWQGNFSDNSTAWDQVSEATKDKLNVTNKGDGEFWMSMYDIYLYCDEVQICNYTPDLDEDGKTDGLDTVTSVLGEWKGATAAGADNKFANPRFQFTVGDKELGADGKLPFVLQMFQYREDRRAATKGYIRADLYSVEKQFQKSNVCLTLRDITNYKTYIGNYNQSYRYRLSPGDYVIVPHTLKPGVENEFLLRLFATVELPCTELTGDVSVYQGKFELSRNINGETVQLNNLQHYYGQWKAGVNAGGYVNNKSFADNPQYALSVEGNTIVPVMVSLKQQQYNATRQVIGVTILRTSDATSSPLDLRFIWNNYNSGSVNTIDNSYIYINGYEGADIFMLQPGNYVLFPYTKFPETEQSYVLSLGTQDGVTVNVRGMNTVEE